MIHGMYFALGYSFFISLYWVNRSFFNLSTRRKVDGIESLCSLPVRMKASSLCSSVSFSTNDVEREDSCINLKIILKVLYVCQILFRRKCVWIKQQCLDILVNDTAQLKLM